MSHQITELIDIEDGITAINQIQTLAEEDPDKLAFIFYDINGTRKTLTRQQVWDKSRKFAALLKRCGVGKGDLVCNTLVNSPERVITAYGTVVAGAITMHGQLLRTDGEDLMHSLRNSRCTTILVDPGHKMGACGILDKFKSTNGDEKYSGLPSLVNTIPVKVCEVPDSERMMYTIDSESEMYVDKTIVASDVMAIFTTSGTTGFSKLVKHTHSNVLFVGAAFQIVYRIDKNSVFFNKHSMGWIGGFVSEYLQIGCTRVTLDYAFGEISDIGPIILKIFNQEQVESALLLPNDIELALAAFRSGGKLNKMPHSIASAGGPLHQVTIEAVGKIAGKISTIYGSTECGLVSYHLMEEMADYRDICVGRHFFCDVKVTDGDFQTVCPFGKWGDIVVRSLSLYNGYLNEPVKTEETLLEGGWYKTGDAGYIDDDGLLYVIGRKNDSISKDGYLHYPGWIERMMSKIPGVEKCAVIGVPDPVHNEEICLCIKPKPEAHLTEDRCREHCKSLFVDEGQNRMFPMPGYFLLFDELITNQNGKLDRKLMKKEVCRRLAIPL